MKKFYMVLMVLLSISLVGCGSKNTETKETTNKKQQTINKSNVGYFVSYDDYVYYWKLNSDSRSKDGLYGEYSESVGITNELVKVDSEGNETTVLKDQGSKELVIFNDKIYTSYPADEYEGRMIYSIDIYGENKQELGKGTIKYSNDERIIGTTDDNKIIAIDLNTNEYKELVSNAQLLAFKDNIIYYGMYDNSSSVYTIYSISETTDQLITLDSSDFDNMNITNINQEKTLYIDQNIEIYLGYRDGSGNVLNGLVKVVIDSNNSATKESLDVSSYEDISNDRVYYKYNYNTQESALVYEDEAGKTTEIITQSGLGSQYGLSVNDETYLSLYGGNNIDNDIYFIVDHGNHNSSGDIGWRYSYTRSKTIYIKYNLNDKTFEKIYEY